MEVDTVREVKEFSNTSKYVLAYYTKQVLQDGTWKWDEYHCVFVKQQLENHYVCVNSWGDIDENPEVELNRPGNRLDGDGRIPTCSRRLVFCYLSYSE